jgi:hypothetical protein
MILFPQFHKFAICDSFEDLVPDQLNAILILLGNDAGARTHPL